MKRIPKQITIGSYEIQIKVLDADAFIRQTGTDAAYGMFCPNSLTIYLCRPPPRNRGAAQIAYQTFWHEVMHAMLFASVRPKLYSDEKLVDNLGHFLSQIMTTARYD